MSETLTANRTVERLLGVVHRHVTFQVPLAIKRSVANRTTIWIVFVQMLAHVTPQNLFGCVASVANGARVGPSVGVMKQMFFQFVLPQESSIAYRAAERFYARMTSHVRPQRAFQREASVTDRTAERLFVTMHTHVKNQTFFVDILLVAKAATKWLHVRVHSHVLIQTVFYKKFSLAYGATVSFCGIVHTHVSPKIRLARISATTNGAAKRRYAARNRIIDGVLQSELSFSNSQRFFCSVHAQMQLQNWFA